MGKGNSYVGWMGAHLTIGKERGKGEGTMCSAATRPERRMRWKGEKTVVATSTGATTEENEEKCKFDSTRILLRLTTNDFCYDSYCFPLYSVGGGGGSSPPPLCWHPRTFPSASRAFLTPSPYIHFSPSLPSPSLSLTCHAAPAKPHRYRVLPSVPPAPRPAP